MCNGQIKRLNRKDNLLISFLIVIEKSEEIVDIIWSEPPYIISKRNLLFTDLFSNDSKEEIRSMISSCFADEKIIQSPKICNLNQNNAHLNIHMVLIQKQILVFGYELLVDIPNHSYQSIIPVFEQFIKLIKDFTVDNKFHGNQTIAYQFEKIQKLNNEHINTKRLLEKTNARLKLENENRILSERKHKAMIANISDVIAVIDKNKRVTYVSENIEKYFGWSSADLIGKDIFFTMHPDDLPRVKKDFENILNYFDKVIEIEYRFRSKQGDYRYIQLSTRNMINDNIIDGLLINFKDISEKKAMESRIKNQQKLESIGTLASGVAHEINNPLNGIS